MPIYDFKCSKCGKVEKDQFFHSWEDSHMTCPDCKIEMDKLIGAPFPKCFPAEGVYLEHVSPTGKTFHSTKEMREFERKNDMELGYLL